MCLWEYRRLLGKDRLKLVRRFENSNIKRIQANNANWEPRLVILTGVVIA